MSKKMIINIAIYKHLKDFLEYFPDKNEEDFEEYNNPFYQLMIASAISSKDKKIFRFCLIDENFKEFLNENKFTDIISSIKTYMNNLTDSEVKNLWKNSKPSRNIELMLYPFAIISESLNENTYFKLSQDNIMKFKDLLNIKTNIPENNIYIPGYISSFENLINYGESLLSIAENYFYDNKIITYKKFEEQKNNKECNIYLYCVPIFIRKDLEYKVTEDFVKDLLAVQTPNYTLESDDIKNIINIEETVLPLTDTLVYTDDLPYIYEDINKLINKETKRKKFLNKIKLFKK